MTTATANSTPRANGDGKPTALPVLFDSISDFLRTGKRFVLWKYGVRGSKPTKLPYMPNGQLADTTDPETWSTFEEVKAAYLRGGWDGIGRVHIIEDNLTGLDCDKVRDAVTGEITPEAAKVLEAFGGYVEVSASGYGVRGFAFGRKPGKDCRRGDGHFEMYDGETKDGKDGGRYLTLTGHRLPGCPSDVPENQEGINAVYDLVIRKKAKAKPKPVMAATQDNPPSAFSVRTSAACPLPLTDGELARWRCLKAEKQDRIIALWGGDLSAYGNDDSRGDVALCSFLVILTNGERDRVESLFGQSALGTREKWTERPDYRERTLDLALDGFQPWRDDPADRKCRSKPKQAGSNNQDDAIEEKFDSEFVAIQTITVWLKDTLDPRFKRADRVHSERQQRLVARSNVTPTSEILQQLVDAGIAPKDRRGVILDSLPKLFRDWLPFAWGDLLKNLDEEGVTGEIVDSAEREFRAKLRDVFKTVVSLAYGYGKGMDESTQVQRDPMIEWAVKFAKPSPKNSRTNWESVRGFSIWSRRHTTGLRVDDNIKGVCVAFRAELIAQLRAPGWGIVTHEFLSHLCHLYGLGRSVKVQGGDARAIELSPDFLADLLNKPMDDQEADGRTAQGHAHEEESCPSVRRSTQVDETQGVIQDTYPGHPLKNRAGCPGRLSGLTRTPTPDTYAQTAPSVRVECPGSSDGEEFQNEGHL